ncbi:hypothetical protein [uncultured Sulfitobacter sp.]|uniref:hypothetical protein n=1 Tax=uncultured Sulfitobacter sp. TaxID=191468 RepID=UPI002592BDD5|nr:hypothetical protein [uncultured Sulfitobacter sp.]
MARIRKTDAPENETDLPPSDDIRRFIVYAGDLIEEQRSVRDELTAARTALTEASNGYQRTSRALAKREAEGVTVHIGSDVDKARQSIALALTEPLARAEAIARETRITAFLSGLTGAAIGAGGVTVLLILDLI